MKRRNAVYILLVLFAFLALMPMKAEASWKTKNGKTYYYTSKGKKAKGWLKYNGKRYYFDGRGVMLTGWQQIDGHYYYFAKGRKRYGAMLKGHQTIAGKRYYFSNLNGRLRTGWYSIGKKRYFSSITEGIHTGIRDIDGQTYMFNEKGVLQKGWRSYRNNTYYCTRKTGSLARGLGSISGKLYYFDEFGIMQKDRVITVNDISYSINSSGICTRIAANSSTPEDMLFFTLYESGMDGYGQVGGDSGNACGKYQFDRRYSLIPLVKYCYQNDPVVFSAFAPYAKWSNTSKYQEKLKGNKKFYRAWTSIYKAYPFVFKNYQDAFAMKEYYEPTEKQLKAWGIDISSRPYVVKGAVFSYSIQHGAYTAAMAVRDAKIKKSASNEDFLKKLYKFRISRFPLYRSRYIREMNDALSRL